MPFRRAAQLPDADRSGGLPAGARTHRWPLRGSRRVGRTSVLGVRYALTRIQVRGRRGQLVATDGRHLLMQGGFSFPWSEDVLIPALPLFVSRDLPANEPIAIGRTDRHVSLRIGPWTFHLEIDSNGRYPNADSVIPKTDNMASRLHLSEDDARFLVHVLPRLPGDK